MVPGKQKVVNCLLLQVSHVYTLEPAGLCSCIHCKNHVVGTSKCAEDSGYIKDHISCNCLKETGK